MRNCSLSPSIHQSPSTLHKTNLVACRQQARPAPFRSWQPRHSASIPGVDCKQQASPAAWPAASTLRNLESAHVLGCRQQASPATIQELASWDAAGTPCDSAIWQSARGCLKVRTRAQLLDERPTTGLGRAAAPAAGSGVTLSCHRCFAGLPCHRLGSTAAPAVGSGTNKAVLLQRCAPLLLLHLLLATEQRGLGLMIWQSALSLPQTAAYTAGSCESALLHRLLIRWKGCCPACAGGGFPATALRRMLHLCWLLWVCHTTQAIGLGVADPGGV